MLRGFSLCVYDESMQVPSIKLNDGHQIPQLGLGTWMITGEAVAPAVEAAISAGYRHFDTASFYKNERQLGEALRDNGLKREDLFITSKLWPAEFFNPSKAIKGALERLGYDYVDMYLVHYPPLLGAHQLWQQLEQFQAAGLAKSIGVSNYDSSDLEKLLDKAKVVPAVNQAHINPWHYPIQTIKTSLAHGIVIEAYSPLSHNHNLDDERVNEMAKRNGISRAQLLIRWTIQHGWVSLPKSASPERIAQNIDVFGFELNPANMTTLDHLSKA